MTTVPRLIDSFIPTHYDLSVDLSHAADRTFSGMVSIEGEMTAEAKRILLHA